MTWSWVPPGLPSADYRALRGAERRHAVTARLATVVLASLVGATVALTVTAWTRPDETTKVGARDEILRRLDRLEEAVGPPRPTLP